MVRRLVVAVITVHSLGVQVIPRLGSLSTVSFVWPLLITVQEEERSQGSVLSSSWAHTLVQAAHQGRS